ncbi:hypothetical protein Tco_0499497 [Tanacetum coccineum]
MSYESVAKEKGIRHGFKSNYLPRQDTDNLDFTRSVNYIHRCGDDDELLDMRMKKHVSSRWILDKLEAYADPGEVFNTLLCLGDDVRNEHARLGVLDDCITQAEEQIETNEEHVRVIEVEANDG